VGALKGLAFVVTALFYSVLAGGVWAALVLIWSGQTRSVFVDLGRLFLRTSRQDDRTPSRGGGLPFSVAIGVGTLTTLTLEWRARLA
jgi:Flp pilus assembly protein protease CpaA